LQESLQVIAAGLEAGDPREWLHRKAVRIEAGEFSKVREAFVIAAFRKISLGGRIAAARASVAATRPRK